MILSPEQAQDVQGYALQHIQSLLEEKLNNAPYSAPFREWDGVAVVTNPEELPQYRATKRPFIFLEVASYDITKRGRSRHQLEISAEVITNSACSPAEEPLKAVLMTICHQGYVAMRDAGLNTFDIQSGQGRNQNPQRINPHTIRCLIITE